MTQQAKSHIATGQAVLIHFYGSWCHQSQQMKPIWHEMLERVGNRALVLQMDIDTHADLAQEYEVFTVPTSILFLNGYPIWRKSGAVTLPELVQELNYHLH